MMTKRKVKFIVLIVSLVAFMGGVVYCGYSFFLRRAYPMAFYDYVCTSAEKYGVDRALMFAVIKSESNFDSDAQSHAGAIGLMQIMPETFDWLQSHNLAPYLDEGHLRDPSTNIEYGAYLLSILQSRYTSIVEVLCAYNAGIGTVDRWLGDASCSHDGRTLCRIPYPDTDEYVKNVLKSRDVYKNLYSLA